MRHHIEQYQIALSLQEHFIKSTIEFWTSYFYPVLYLARHL